MPWMMAAGMGINAISSGIGAAASKGDREAALQANQQALQQFLDINIPDPAQQQLALQQFAQTGSLTPELEQAFNQSGTELSKIHTDPALQGAQMQALGQLQNEGLSGGLSLQDQATMQGQINDANAAAHGRDQAITSQFQQQGMGGTGLQLAAQLQNAQNANQTQAMSSLNAASAARQRALQAIMGAGQLGGQMQQQQYGQQANQAQAQDAINRFNMMNMQNVSNTNTQARNAAQEYNLNLQQQTANANTNLANYQQQYNKNTYQQQFQDAMSRAGGATGVSANIANQYNNNANATANQWSQMGQGINQGATAYAQYQNNQDSLAAYNARTAAMNGGGSGGGYANNSPSLGANTDLGFGNTKNPYDTYGS